MLNSKLNRFLLGSVLLGASWAGKLHQRACPISPPLWKKKAKRL